MEISSGFGVFADYNMVELTAGFMAVNGRNNQGGRTTLQVFELDELSLGKREPVRQLKQAGGIMIPGEQRLQIHNAGAKIHGLPEKNSDEFANLFCLRIVIIR